MERSERGGGKNQCFSLSSGGTKRNGTRRRQTKLATGGQSCWGKIGCCHIVFLQGEVGGKKCPLFLPYLFLRGRRKKKGENHSNRRRRRIDQEGKACVSGGLKGGYLYIFRGKERGLGGDDKSFLSSGFERKRKDTLDLKYFSFLR